MKTTKKFTVWTKKGGIGKTSIATEIALRLEIPIVTNEQNTALKSLFDASQLLQLGKDEKVPSYQGKGLVFDFGGYADPRVIDAIKQSDWVLVPAAPAVLDIQEMLSSIIEIRKHNKNILVIANKIENDKGIEKIKGALDQLGSYPILPIQKSCAVLNIFEHKMSVEKAVKKSRLRAWNYKKVNKQISDIVKFIQLVK